MARFRGAGGVEWDIDVPREGTPARERHDEQVTKGLLVPLDVPVDGAPEAAEVAEEPTAEQAEESVARPKANAGRPAWETYAKSVDVAVTEAMSRDEIRAAVEARETAES